MNPRAPRTGAYVIAVMPAAIAALALLLTPAARAVADAPRVPLVEPAELTRRPELLGHEIAVEDRVQFFQQHEGQGFDQLHLKRTDVIFRLPPHLRPQRNDDAYVVRVQGVLKQVAGEWVCDVTAMTPLPRDLERLEEEVRRLPPGDVESRRAWARWAERRGTDFKDKALIERGRTLEGEALRIDAKKADAANPAAHLLQVAQQARERHVPEPEPSALYHQAFRVRLAKTGTPGDLDALIEQIKSALPGSAKPAVTRIDLSAWLGPYNDDPSGTYRKAPEPVRLALDRLLLLDTFEKSFRLRAADPPQTLRDLAARARAELTDRPELADQLDQQAIDSALQDPESVSREDLIVLTRALTERGQAARATDLKRRWLDNQRLHRLSREDAEGRLLLARQYREMIDDRATAHDLLVDALKIDPAYRDAEDELKRMGFRKYNDEWVEAGRPGGGEAGAGNGDAGGDDAGSAPAGPTGGVLHGLTRQQVVTKMGGRPDQVVRSATQGQIVEQWIYRSQKGTQYVNFVRRPNSPVPVVEAYYSLP